MRPGERGVVVGVVTAIVLAACSQAAPAEVNTPAAAVATSAIEGATAVVTAVEGHFNPTEAVGGGANSSSAVADVSTVLAAIPQAAQLKFTANSSPPGATGADVQSVSIIGQDPSAVLKSLDATAKKTLGDAILTAAANAWPNASISLLISSPAGGGQVIGTRPKGGPNTVIAS